MFKPRPCGCKGIRTCLLCEAEYGLTSPTNGTQVDLKDCYEYCHLCDGKAWKGTEVWRRHPHLQEPKGEAEEGIPYPGVLLIPNFLSEEEEAALVQGCDQMEWDLSQSGRKKQNFGPKTNFNKMKINGKTFQGFPQFGQFAQEKLRTVPLLSDFQTIEQCAIEYRTETGACIDPHIDDCWVWGERVISLNLLSPSVLTMTKYTGGKEKYNLKVHYDHEKNSEPSEEKCSDSEKIVRIPMPARSLLVLYGPARYEWEHGILRSDITGRRICMAYREFTKQYLPGGNLFEEVGKSVVEKAQNFWEIDKNDVKVS